MLLKVYLIISTQTRALLIFSKYSLPNLGRILRAIRVVRNEAVHPREINLDDNKDIVKLI